jgi:hypothetical protein
MRNNRAGNGRHRARRRADRARAARRAMTRNGAVLLALIVVLVAAAPVGASIEKVEGGIKFTYFDPDAAQVNLAGTFNGWSTTATPMVKDEAGYWTAVVSLGTGKHEYKFVVDGAWITDQDNPNTKPDPYGGVNSVCEIDGTGNIVSHAAALAVSNTPLNARVFIGGRYLSRTSVEKDIEDDPRWRMHRPVQNVDFNFRVTISDIVQGYTRLRIDSAKDFLRPNDISAYLDEAHITVAPEAFSITGYDNEEILWSNDPLHYVGDVDLPGTIYDDHIKAGKGTAGAVFKSSRYGFDLEGFVANVYDYDINNDPNLFDNTGTDIYHGRVSRSFWGVTPGADFFMRRNIWWLDFTNVVGTTPANTGVPRLDAYLDESNDPSTWFEFDDRTYFAGFDVVLGGFGERLVPQFEYLRGKMQQGFITSNRSGIDLGNGPIDVPILDRDEQIFHATVQSTLPWNLSLIARHTRTEILHPNADESMLYPMFQPDDVAQKHIFFGVVADPPTPTLDYSEATIQWSRKNLNALLWLQRSKLVLSYPAAGIDRWTYSWSASPKITWQALPKLNLELEQQYGWFEGSSDLVRTGSSIETITRGGLDLTKRLSAIFDVRVIHYRYDADSQPKETHTFVDPYGGFEYKPMHRVSLVLAYGVDPLNFDIDYDGREVGRYDFRQQYLWDNPTASYTDAERALKDRRIVSLRAIFNF